MKKLLLSIGILATLSLLVACGDTDYELDAMELISRSRAVSTEMDEHVSNVLEMEIIITMNMGIMNVSMPMQMRLEVESEERSSLEVNMSMMGTEVSINTFTRDGYEYTRINEFGEIEYTRTAVDIDDAEGVFDSVDFDSIAEEWLEGSRAVKLDDGYRLEFTYNTIGILSFLENFDLGLIDIGEIDLDSDHVGGEALEDWHLSIIIYLDEDYVQTSSTITMFFETVMQEGDISFDATLDLTMTLIPQPVTIDFPLWLDEALFD